MLRRQTFQVSGVNIVCMPVPREIFYPSVVYSFIFCRLVSGGLMVFPAVSRVSLFEADDDTDDCLLINTEGDLD